jgi:hypothetical protein
MVPLHQINYGRLNDSQTQAAKIMNTTSTLTGSHLRTYKTIFQHPISHNLRWHDVQALFRQLGEVEEEANGNLKVTRNGQILVLHRPHTKDVAEVDDVMNLRHFLVQSETIPSETDEKDAHWLLVIDHHEARLFQTEMHDAIPQRILPRAPEDYVRHTQNAKEFSKGKDVPDANSFFKPVAKALQSAGRILIFGTGTGTSSEMDQFIVWLKIHHPEPASRIIGSLVVDKHHLTENQLLAMAREFYAEFGMA